MEMKKYLIKYLQFVLSIELHANVYHFFDMVLIQTFSDIDLEGYLPIRYNPKHYLMRQRILDEWILMVFVTKQNKTFKLLFIKIEMNDDFKYTPVVVMVA